MISCVLLAAGLSRRFGSPKALAKLNNITVIEHLLGTLTSSNLDEIIVVLGSQADDIKPHILNHTKVRVVYNKDYILGQTSSFKAGIRAIQGEPAGIMLLPVDFPWVRRDTINALIKFFLAETPKILIPTYKDRRGHPPLFSGNYKKLFLEMDHTVGINTLEHTCEQGLVHFPVGDPGVIESFNTPEEFEGIKSRFL